MTCSTAYEAVLQACPDTIVVDAGLEPSTEYWWCLVTARGKLYQRKISTDNTGKLTIDVATALPAGSLNRYSGPATLTIRNGGDYLTVVPMTFGEAVHASAVLYFQETDGDGANNHIYAMAVAPDEDDAPVDRSSLTFHFDILVPKLIVIDMRRETSTPTATIDWGDGTIDEGTESDSIVFQHNYAPGSYDAVLTLATGVTAPEARVTNTVTALYLLSSPGGFTTSIGPSLSKCYRLQFFQVIGHGLTDIPKLPLWKPGSDEPYEQIRSVNLSGNNLTGAACSKVFTGCNAAGWPVGYVDVSGCPGANELTAEGIAAKAALTGKHWTINV